MRFCEECGAKLEDNVSFCEECGAKLEPLVVATESEENAVYKFCEECGARIKITDSFCESCGTTIGAEELRAAVESVAEPEKTVPVAIAAEPVVEDKKDPVVTQAVTSASECISTKVEQATKAEPKKKTAKKVLGIVAALILIAVFAVGGYILGRRSAELPKPQQTADNKGDTGINNTQPSEPTAVPTVAVAIVATSSPTPTPTPTQAPEPVIEDVSIFEGFRSVEYMGSVVTVDTDGLYMVLDTTMKPEPSGYITDGEHYLECEFTDNYNYPSTLIHPKSYYYDWELYEEGDLLYVIFADDGVSIRWGYCHEGVLETYYDGFVPMENVECIGQYTRSLANTLKKFESSGKLDTNNPFKTVKDGTVVEVVYTGDDRETFAFGLVHNAESDIMRIEFYDYEQDSYMDAYVEGQLYYDKEAVYYLQPIYLDDDIYWGEIPLIEVNGEIQYDLSVTDIYCEVRLKVVEDGVSIYWSVHENGAERVFYDDFFESKYMQRKAYVKHY